MASSVFFDLKIFVFYFIESEPDLVLVEPQIETIDLGVDSDSEIDPENSRESNKETNKEREMTQLVTNIKEEIIDEFNEEHNITIDEINDEDGVPFKSVNAKVIEAKIDVEKVEEAINKTDISSSADDAIPCGTNDDFEAEGDCILLNKADNQLTTNTEKEQEISTHNEIKTEVGESNVNAELSTNPDISNASQNQEEIVLPQIINVFGNVKVGPEVLAAIPLVKSTALSTSLECQVVNQSADDIDASYNDAIHIDTTETDAMDIDANDNDDNDAMDIDAIDDNANSNDADESVDEIIRLRAAEFTKDVNKKDEIVKKERDIDIIPAVTNETRPTIAKVAEALINEIKQEIPTEMKTQKSNVSQPFIDISTDVNFVDDGIELIDDGIEFDEEEDDLPSTSNKDTGKSHLVLA